jgi:hypothetical protein
MANLTRRATLCLAALLLLGASAPAAEKEKLTLEEFTRRLPRRIQNAEGTPGDMVNLVMVGSRQQVEETLAAAGWKQVDRTPSEAAVRAVISVLQKKVYTEMPMSELYLFDRPQDYGFAHADPIAVVAERHHFRLWEAPWQTPDGQAIWVGAGTHDIGFEEDKGTGKITHRIDPEVDKERSFISATLEETGRVAGLGYLRPPDPVLEATTATGGPYHSDGRVLAVILK